MSSLYSILLARYHFYPKVKTSGMRALPQLAIFTSEHVRTMRHPDLVIFLKKRVTLALGFLAAAAFLCAYWEIGTRLEPDTGEYYVAYPRNYKFIIDNAQCKTTTPFLIMFVDVAPWERAARDVIRETWGQGKWVLGQRIITLFNLGLPSGVNRAEQQKQVVEENQQHHDLIQSDFIDSHHNLTIKTMMMLEWFSSNCTRASYVIKIDSDVFLNVTNLVKLLLDPGHAKQNYMTGLVWWHSEVLRDKSSKFYIPRHVRAEPEYDPYPLGMAYVMSSDLPRKILRVAPHIRPFFIEDVYLGMCLKYMDIKPTDPPEETMFMVKPSLPLSNCSLSKVIALLTDNHAQITAYWERSRHLGTQC
ncbi:beta-1,3-galactosyltransferase 5-like [Nelusetta ayraudi]|uniref:beta-1,3-galactosyltransferase 5-like n=1 Tax=Nelusetta ayraudi TaxID=303726 RepID=UPI003F729446